MDPLILAGATGFACFLFGFFIAAVCCAAKHGDRR